MSEAPNEHIPQPSRSAGDRLGAAAFHLAGSRSGSHPAPHKSDHEIGNHTLRHRLRRNARNAGHLRSNNPPHRTTAGPRDSRLIHRAAIYLDTHKPCCWTCDDSRVCPIRITCPRSHHDPRLDRMPLAHRSSRTLNLHSRRLAANSTTNQARHRTSKPDLPGSPSNPEAPSKNLKTSPPL